MTCPQCAAEVQPQQKFCGSCGARLESRCPACQAVVPSDGKFCGACGQRLSPSSEPSSTSPAPTAVASTDAPPTSDRFASPRSYTPKHLAEKILVSRSAMEGERKQITVLFTDVSGFTRLSSTLDPEQVHEVMDRCFDVILGAVHRYEGTVNQFLGDGVMALFGAPIAHEDHPHRAVRAALAIQRELERLRQDLQTLEVDFRVRVGINTGLVVVGAIGRDLRMDYTAVGDTTNLASRIVDLAQPGQVAVSQQTQRATEGYFIFDDLGEFEVKGRDEPVRAYVAKVEVTGRTRLEVSKARGLTPLHGRDLDLERLMRAYRRSIERHGAVVLLSGDAGVGKSRLLYEFLRRLESSQVREIEGACLSYGRSMPYHPILDLLQRHLALADGMAGDEIRRRAGERLRALGLEGDEPLTLLAHFLGVSAPPEFLAQLEPAQLKQRTFAIVSEVMLRIGDGAPLVIVLENVHWLDASSEEVLQHLIRLLPGRQVLLVLSARPGFTASWLTPPLAETIVLEGLETGDVWQMIHALLGTTAVSEALVELLFARSEGNPLYLEEIVRQLQETGGLEIEDDETRLSERAANIPATVNDIIAARVDHLEEPLKQALQAGAVVGRQFALAVLARLVRTSDAMLAGQMDRLRALDFVFLVERVLYSFKHALTQEVVYASLLERHRRRLHASVGAVLEELYAGRLDEIVELLAHHFGRSAESEKAVDYALLAAEKAQRRWAHVEALAHFDAALRFLAAMPDTDANRLRRIDAVTKQAEIKFALGRHGEHIQALEAIRELVEGISDPYRRAVWHYWTGFLHSLTGAHPDVAIAHCREASTIADGANLDEIRAYAESCLAQAYTVAGQLGAALAAGERALDIFEARGNVWWACRTLWILSTTANAIGDWARSLEFCQRALRYGQERNDLRLKVVGWWRTGAVHIRRGDAKAGLACCDEALALSPSPYDLAMVRGAHGYGLVKGGDPAAGIAELEECVAWFEKLGLRYPRMAFVVWLVEGYLRLGDHVRARTEAESSLQISREAGYRHMEGAMQRLLGEALSFEDPAAAATHLDSAILIAEEVGSRDELGKALLIRAIVHRRTGAPDSARELLDRARAIFEECGTLDESRRVASLL